MFGEKRREHRREEEEAKEAAADAREAVLATESDDSFVDPDETLEAEEEPTTPPA